MKKIFKFLGIGVAAIVLILFIAFLVINLSGIPSYEVKPVTFQHTSSPEALERGKKLATMLCAGCHMDRSTGKLTGKKMSDAPPVFGEIYSPNITQDMNNGIGSWTDGEILYLLRTGIKRDGKYAPPYMAKLPNMADEDINAIIAFLRSDDRMVAPDPTPDIPPKPSFLVKFLSRVAFKPFPMPSAAIPMPDTADVIAVGEYLLYNLECFSCHSADFTSNNYLDPPMSKGYMGGGNKTLDLKGRVRVTRNLTPDMETGIGSWSKEKFIKAVKYGIVDGQPPLSYPMLPYAQLTDDEAGAIYEYIQTIPAIKNDIERMVYD